MKIRFALVGIGLCVSVVATTKAATTKAAATNVPGAISFNKDIAPILQKNCQSCHRPGEAAPMSFLTYQDVRPWASAIKEAAALKTMPPWFADQRFGHWANDRSLTKADIETLVRWAESGAAEGDPKDAPAPIKFIEGWNIAKPDMVLEMPSEFQVPASGTIDYQYIMIPGKFAEDKWIRMAEIRPGNRAVVHHVIAFVRPPGSKWMEAAKPGIPYVPEKNSEEGGPHEFLVGFAPGTAPEILDSGRAKLIKAGSDIIFQMHYTANGKAATDRTRIGVVFTDEPVKERVFTLGAGTKKFAIPPGDPNYRVDARLEIAHDAKIISYQPHMHLRGKDFEYRITFPDGRTETLLSVPHYSFSWQLGYKPAQELALPAGAVIECTAHYDNSVNNPNNPDATKEVDYGDQSWDEMMIGFFEVAFEATLDPKDLVPKKRAGRAEKRGL